MQFVLSPFFFIFFFWRGRSLKETREKDRVGNRPIENRFEKKKSFLSVSIIVFEVVLCLLLCPIKHEQVNICSMNRARISDEHTDDFCSLSHRQFYIRIIEHISKKFANFSLSEFSLKKIPKKGLVVEKDGEFGGSNKEIPHVCSFVSSPTMV